MSPGDSGGSWNRDPTGASERVARAGTRTGNHEANRGSGQRRPGQPSNAVDGAAEAAVQGGGIWEDGTVSGWTAALMGWGAIPCQAHLLSG